MLYKRGLYLAAALCLVVTVTRAQSVDSVAGKLAGLPTRLFSKIQAQSASLNQQISTQTQKYLARMARREQRMQAMLAAADSNSAKALFGGSSQQYATLARRIQSDTGNAATVMTGQYEPHADTLHGALAFLKQYPQLLAGAGSLTASGGAIPAVSSQVEAKLQGAFSQFQTLQVKLQDADVIKVYITQRQQQISQFLAQHSNFQNLLGKQYSALSQNAYYYRQQIQQYRALLSNPDQMVQTALAYLSRLPAFQNFMKTNSQLGTLFHVPGSYSSSQALTGLQTKAQIAKMVQTQISAAGPNGASALQANLQSAQSQLDGFKDKLSKFGAGNGDMPTPAFKPNAMKTVSFLKRLQFGFNFQTTPNSYYYPTVIDLGVSVGYQLGHSNIIGIGASWKIGAGNGIGDVAITGQGVGLRSFLNIKIKGSFSATGGFEYNFTTPYKTFEQLKQIQYWQRSGLLGVTKTVSMKSKLFKQTTLSVLWDFLSYHQSPPTAPFIFRVGYTL